MDGQIERGRGGRLGRAAAWCVGAGLALLLVSAVALALSGLGHRWGGWSYRAGFAVLRAAVYGVGLTAALCLIGTVLGVVAGARRVIAWGAAGLAVVVAVAWVPLGHIRMATRVPPIHDITTDTSSPPGFVAILPLRRAAPNPAEYGGPALAAQQQLGYPDLAPVVLRAPPDRVFDRAVAVAGKLGWQIVAAAPAEGRLEATDTTRWFGFKDDVVVRVAPAPGGTRVDVRSVSRVGRSDLGTNARRIRAFLAELRAAVAA
jgi:uncharacterized protein (DUF1499 family)